MKKSSVFPVFFSVVMLLFVFFVAWYLPAVNERLFQIEDTRLSLETSQGRERRQQREYDETAAAIPVVQAEIERVVPLNEAMLEDKNELKARLKELKKEKEALEKKEEPSDAVEEKDHE